MPKYVFDFIENLILIYPLLTPIVAIVSTLKSKHIWCVSMYLCAVIYTFVIWQVSPLVDGYPLVVYRWYELVVIYLLTIGVPLFLQLKSLNRKTFLAWMWGATYLNLLLEIWFLVVNNL